MSHEVFILIFILRDFYVIINIIIVIIVVVVVVINIIIIKIFIKCILLDLWRLQTRNISCFILQLNLLLLYLSFCTLWPFTNIRFLLLVLANISVEIIFNIIIIYRLKLRLSIKHITNNIYISISLIKLTWFGYLYSINN